MLNPNEHHIKENLPFDILEGEKIESKNPILRFPGGSLEIKDGGQYRNTAGVVDEYDAGIKLSFVKSNGKCSFTDFLNMLKALNEPAGHAFLDIIEQRAEPQI